MVALVSSIFNFFFSKIAPANKWRNKRIKKENNGYLYLSSQNISTESCNENVGPQKWEANSGNFCLICIVQKPYMLTDVQIISHLFQNYRGSLLARPYCITHSWHNLAILASVSGKNCAQSWKFWATSFPSKQLGIHFLFQN